MRQNKTGYTGVKKTPAGRYVPKYAGIAYGTYDTAEEAHEVYKQKKEAANG